MQICANGELVRCSDCWGSWVNEVNYSFHNSSQTTHEYVQYMFSNFW